MSCSNTVRIAVVLSAFAATSAAAANAEFVLKAQTFNSPESVSGKNIATFVDDVEVMSGGRIKIEMFYSSSVVKTAETFDAVRNNILDLDVTSAAYLVGKDKAFQMVGDIMGGYENPWQMYAWLYNADGYDQAQALYDKYDMQLLAWMVPGTESLASTKPLEGFESLQSWKFRSPPGLQTNIFESVGATPVVMDFTEVFTALETGIIEGADQSNLAGTSKNCPDLAGGIESRWHAAAGV